MDKNMAMNLRGTAASQTAGFETIMARFERPCENGFDFTEWKLPCISNIKAFGFSEEEIMEQERYLRNNSTLIWEIAREGEAA
ncbi:MAG: hypothetical protein IJP92_12605 [Lachnospiraceae bacterium]|nr:hypothetical protein [Lachnospiraceae bacterium]